MSPEPPRTSGPSSPCSDKGMRLSTGGGPCGYIVIPCPLLCPDTAPGGLSLLPGPHLTPPPPRPSLAHAPNRHLLQLRDGGIWRCPGPQDPSVWGHSCNIQHVPVLFTKWVEGGHPKFPQPLPGRPSGMGLCQGCPVSKEVCCPQAKRVALRPPDRLRSCRLSYFWPSCQL